MTIHGSSSRATHCSSEIPRGPTSRSRRAKARKASSTRCDGSWSRRRRQGIPELRRLAVWEGDELEGVDDDRLRATLQSSAGTRQHRALHRRVHRCLGTAAAEYGTHRGDEPWPFRRRAAGAERARGARSGHADLDVRTIEAFAAGHYPGALSVPVSGTLLSTKAAFVLDAGPITIAASDEDEVALATRACTRSATWTSRATSSQLEPRRSRSSR